MGASGQAVLSGVIPIPDAATEQLEATLREHARFVYQVAYSVLRHHHDAEDAAQETFLRVFRYRHHLPAVRNPRAWLARIAWRVAVGRKRTVSEVSLDDAAAAVRQLRAAGRSPEEIAADQQMTALLEELIVTLPRKIRDPLTLSTLAELTSADIAEVLGIPEASVRTRLFRARQLLREKLAEVLVRKI